MPLADAEWDEVGEKSALPAHTRQGLEGHSQFAAWAFSNLAATRPRALTRINYLDTPLIPRDTPVTKKGIPAPCQGVAGGI